MASTAGDAGDLRAAAADLELAERAQEAVRAAERHRDEIAREIKDRGLVTVEQLAKALGITRRGLYKRLLAGGPES